MKPKSVLAAVVVLTVAAIGLRGLLGSGRPERERTAPVDAAPEESRRELSPVVVLERSTPVSPSPTSDPAGRAEVRAVPAPAPTPAGPTWWGRAIDAETGKPLGRASFAVLRAEPNGRDVFARAERDGHIVAPISTWNEEVVVVRVPGYATAYAVASGAHRSRDEAQVVQLWRAATIAVRVMGARATRGTISVPEREFLQAEGDIFLDWTDFTWAGEKQADGRLLFRELPPRVRLTVEVAARFGTSRTRELAMEPGEKLELLWPVGGELTLAGHALDPEGVPVVGVELWILAGELPRRNLAPEDERRAFAVTRTELDGSFAFAGLVPGRYHVAPAASGAHFVPLATSFALQGPAEERVLTCLPGVRISGSVRAADGRPITSVVVTASAPGLLFLANVKDDGSFELGPLAPGPYELVARADGLDSAPLAAQGGDADLELVLPALDAAPR